MRSFRVRAREAHRGEDVISEAAIQSSRPLSRFVNQPTRRRDFTQQLTNYRKLQTRPIEKSCSLLVVKNGYAK
jgi:hypothetical protein